jgi:excisionase family DNA binding protein
MRIPKDIWQALDTAAFLSVPQAAAILNCDERTVRNAAARGEIPATRVGVTWRIPTSWLRRQVRPPEQAA